MMRPNVVFTSTFARSIHSDASNMGHTWKNDCWPAFSLPAGDY